MVETLFMRWRTCCPDLLTPTGWTGRSWVLTVTVRVVIICDESNCSSPLPLSRFTSHGRSPCGDWSCEVDWLLLEPYVALRRFLDWIRIKQNRILYKTVRAAMFRNRKATDVKNRWQRSYHKWRRSVPKSNPPQYNTNPHRLGHLKSEKGQGLDGYSMDS